MCGSQRCYGDDESISTCGRYKGDIEGIEKKESLQELLDKVNKWKASLSKEDFNEWRKTH
jgi:hypothetical protein